MEVEFKTDIEKINFLLEADADLRLGLLVAEGKLEFVTEELPEDERPKYITNFIGSKQKLVDWIWGNTPEDSQSVLDAFSGSSVVGYMYKTKGLQVFSNDRLTYCYHAARAIVDGPKVLLADEPMSAIDVAARVRILESFEAIRNAEPDMAIIMVSHDLGVVQHIADRILVLHDGRAVEVGPTDQVLGHPRDEYTKRLVEAASL